MAIRGTTQTRNGDGGDAGETRARGDARDDGYGATGAEGDHR